MAEAADVVDRVYEAFGRGDLDALLRELDPHVVWVVAGRPWPAGTYHGHDGVREFWKRQEASFEGYSLDPEAVHQDGDRLVVPVSVRARRRANLREIDRRLLDVWTVAGGRVRHVSFHGKRGADEGLPPSSQGRA
jgi:ketosteroid isomerase-like protein